MSHRAELHTKANVLPELYVKAAVAVVVPKTTLHGIPVTAGVARGAVSTALSTLPFMEMVWVVADMPHTEPEPEALASPEIVMA
jgi:hypothetical protein